MANENVAGRQRTIWSFDLGKASIGEAVRDLETHQFLHKDALLIPADFAETKTASDRRRMHRTRQAHHAREEWLDRVLRESGIEPLCKRKTEWNESRGEWEVTQDGDPRLEREFPPRGDSTCYTSCLLRIRLLRGEKLEAWQIYKAFHSAIQRRGYDPNIPWKSRESRRRIKVMAEEEEGTAERMEAYQRELNAMAPGKPEFHFPSYFDAWKMGLWDPDKPETLRERIDCRAQTKRNQIVPRSLVESEIRALVDCTAAQCPRLAGKADYLLFGPAGIEYASYYKEERAKHGLREGGANDWQGVVGQKIPRFDNRIIEKCVLIPRLNVCKLKAGEKGRSLPESMAAVQALFLVKLKNMRVVDRTVVRGLNAAEIRVIFDDSKRTKFGVTEAQWKKYCARFDVRPLPGYESVDEIRIAGRARFCRLALAILKRLILSGETPQQAHERESYALGGNRDPQRGLMLEDLRFLLQMGETWEGIYIPNQKLDALVRTAADSGAAIKELIGSQNDPVVRHRLGLFAERLDDMEERFGAPEEIVLEFVREDYMGEKARLALMKFQRERAKERKQAREDARAAGAHEGAAGLKMELYKVQRGECVYTAAKLIPERLDEYVIDHIVPRAQGGPDSIFNYVLTTTATNDAKGTRTPHQWLSTDEQWDAFKNRVRALAGSLRNKKVQLLIQPDAAERAERYTALAETAWIAKLAQAIISLRFGWKDGIDGGRRRVTVVSGGLTARIRRKYRLNSLLNPNATSEEEAEEKNRDDDRHHALDAMVISFIPNWARNPTKEHFFRFPPGVTPEMFAREIAEVRPKRIARHLPGLEETIYGERSLLGHRYAVGREPLVSIATKEHKGKLQLKPRKDIETHRIVDGGIRRLVEEFLDDHPLLDLAEWLRWCDNARLGESGPRVSKILVKKSGADQLNEYVVLHKHAPNGRPQLKRAGSHTGYFVFWEVAAAARDPSRRSLKVRPVYAFESVPAARKKLDEQAGCEVVGYFHENCQVRIERLWEFKGETYPADEYTLKSIWTQGNAVLKHAVRGLIGARPKHNAPIGLRILIDAGMRCA